LPPWHTIECDTVRPIGDVCEFSVS